MMTDEIVSIEKTEKHIEQHVSRRLIRSRCQLENGRLDKRKNVFKKTMVKKTCLSQKTDE